MFNPRADEAATRQLLEDPRLVATDLVAIAAVFPSLAPLVAAHPAMTPGTATCLRWLANAPEEAVLTSVGEDSGAAGPAPEAAVPTVPSPPTTMPDQQAPEISGPGVPMVLPFATPDGQSGWEWAGSGAPMVLPPPVPDGLPTPEFAEPSGTTGPPSASPESPFAPPPTEFAGSGGPMVLPFATPDGQSAPEFAESAPPIAAPSAPPESPFAPPAQFAQPPPQVTRQGPEFAPPPVQFASPQAQFVPPPAQFAPSALSASPAGATASDELSARGRKRLVMALCVGIIVWLALIAATIWFLNSQGDEASSGSRGTTPNSTEEDQILTGEQAVYGTTGVEAEPGNDGIGQRIGGTSASGRHMLPDFADRPTLGAPVDLRELLGNRFQSAVMVGLLNDDTGLALGQGAVAEASGEVNAGGLAAFDLRSGERRWEVNLVEMAGLSPEEAGSWLAVPDGQGQVLVEFLGDAQVSLTIVGSDGATVATAQVPGSLVTCEFGIALVESDEGETISAYKMPDLQTPLWQAPAGHGYPLVDDRSGTLWAVTEAGYVDAATGQPAAFGQDNAQARYLLAPVDEFLGLFKIDMVGQTVTRIEPTGGSSLWAEPVAIDSIMGLGFSPEAMMVQEDGNMFSGTNIIAFDLDSGEELWRAESSQIQGNWYFAEVAVGDPLLAYAAGADSELVALSKGGEEIFRIDCANGCEFVARGQRIAYLEELDFDQPRFAIRAIDLNGDKAGAELWALEGDLPASATGLRFEAVNDRVWLQAPCSSAEAGEYHDVVWALS
ncbi:MAG: hypothetical protein LBG11_08880 [Bifidobacteriaceae bacterium]|jgi:outer membrane protein assembly factor BamB|nr:hypothetical protein [Bifidobacteriaceae bacterium]